MRKMNIVIGSGPAGLACAHALLEKGKEVLVIDAGFQVEEEQRDLLTKLKTTPDIDSLERLKAIQNNPKLSSAGLHTKLNYGSDFPYRGAEEYLGLVTKETGLLPSLSVGGLSNVWGASALPYLQEDIQDWPITANDLAPHYRKIIEKTGLSGKQDELAELFPLFTERPGHLEASSQARYIFESLQPQRERLKQEGIHYGSSRVMIGPNPYNTNECVYCGQCIYGCPYGCIYNSGDDLMGLLKRGHPELQYKTNIIVSTVREEGDQVRVSGINRLTNASVELTGERVFLGAGIIPSTRIMLKSLGLYDQSVEVKDSQYFLFPMLTLKGHKEAVTEALYTVTQMFLEIQDKDVSPYTVHLQFYTYNDVVTKTLEQKFRFLPLVKDLLVHLLEHRLMIVQGYLHSEHSGKVNLTLTRDPGTNKERFMAEGIVNPETKKRIGKVFQKITGPFAKLGMFPIAAALELCLPGRGFHCGGTFPMRAKPGPLESDIHGRVGGAARIHLVDASIFPSVPATTITLTAMANAYRIGSGDY